MNSPTEKDEHGYLSNVVEITADEESEEVEEEEEDEEDVSSNSSSSSNHHHTTSSPIVIGGNNRQHEIKSHVGVPASSPPRRATTSVPQPVGVGAYGGQQQPHHQSHTSPTHEVSPTVKQPHHQPHTTTAHHTKENEKTEAKDGEAKQYSNVYGYQEEIFPENKKNPPILPPHLRYTPLNSSKRFHYDPGLLPIPLHVTVNHAYFAERDNMNKVGVTQRYKDKFCTVVLYKPKHTELKKYQNIVTN